MTTAKKASKNGHDACWSLFNGVFQHVPRLLLYGPPGTGKSFTADQSARKAGFNVYSITLTPDTPAAEVRGHWIEGKDGVFVWHDGPGIRAWKDPNGLLLINEIDRGSPDVQSLMYAICDDCETAALYLPNGDDLRPHPNFRVIATTNAEPEDLPDGLKDRFPARININTVHPAALAKVSKRYRASAEASCNELDLSRRFSIRSWIQFSRLAEKMPKTKRDTAGSVVFGKQWKDVSKALAVAEVAVDNEA